MSTLPRTRSLTAADTSSLSRKYRDRNRPSSLCESSWTKVDSNLQDRLRRTPSQANNLSTTVPTSIVNKTLGGRHTPTRNSLRHSRMAVLARKNAKAEPPNRWRRRTKNFSRVTSLVAIAYMLVGVMGGLLALWLLKWAPSLHFKEIPHYPGCTIIVSGIFASLLIHCLSQERQKRSVYFLRVVLIILLTASLLSCACVCVFDILHLINLAPMECRMRSDVIIQPAKREGLTKEAVSPLKPSNQDVELLPHGLGDDEEYNDEGSGGGGFLSLRDEGGFPVDKNLEIETTPLSSFDAQINSDIYVNVKICVCFRRKEGWRVVMEYSKLSCDEVKNMLPIFLVASCVVTVVGGVLSAVLLFLFCSFKKEASFSPSEAKPFIYRSNQPLNNLSLLNGNNRLYR